MKVATVKIGSWLFLASVCWHCGTDNIYDQLEADDAAEDAAIELENGNPNKAISILEKALDGDAENYRLISLLSAAYAQRGGVSMIDLAANMVDNNSSDDSETQNGLTALWPMLPPATADNVADVRTAVSTLRTIPNDNRTDSDNFKLAILSTTLASLELKALDINNDGRLSAQELAGLTGSSADSIMAALQGAAGALNSIDGDLGESTDAAASRINEVVSAVNSSEGETNADKINNYFN